MPDKNSRAPRRKAVNLNSQWLQNTLKSMGIAASDALGELLPATSGTISTGAKVASDAAKTLRATKGGSRLVQNALMNNQLVKTGQSFFKNAIDDLKSGNWNEDRSDVGEMFDDMDDMFGDMDEMFDDDEGTDVNIENNISSSGDATLKAIDRQAEYTVRSAKAMTDTMVSIGSASLIKVEEIGSKTLSELVNINSTLSAILDYNNTNMTRFIEASIGYYDQMMTKDESSTTSSEIRPENLYSDRGLDVGSYKDYIKQNILKLKDESTVGSMVSMIAENADMLFANPINAGMKMLVKGLIPSVAKNAMQAFDESVQNFIPFILEKIGHLGEGKGGMLGTALQYVGRIFGVRSTATKEVDFSNIKTGSVPYNGMANHTIVEIIPKYLRESNNYLREIAEKITGKSDEEMSKNVTGFDWESGRFKRLEDIKRGNIESLTNESVGTLLNSEFGRKLTAIMSSDKVLTDANDRKNSSNAIQQMILNMLDHQGEMDFASSDYLDAILKITSSDNIKNALRDALTEMQTTSDSAIGSAKGTIGRARTTHNNAIRILRENASTNGLYQTEAGNANTDLIQQERDYLISNISTAPTPTPPPPAPPTSGQQSGQQGSVISPEEAAAARREAIRTSLADQNANVNTSGSTGSILATPFATGKKMLDAVMAGNTDQAWDAFINGFKESFSKMGKFLSTHFFTPIKTALFGTKDENGYKHGGIFEGVNNRMKESFYSFRRLITGKGYRTADGNTIPDASDQEMENTVVGKLKKSVSWFKDAIKERLFGNEKDNADPKKDEKEKGGLVGKAKRGITSAASSLVKGLNGWKNALFGTKGKDGEDEEEGKKVLEDLKKKAADIAPSAITGGIGGGLLGMMVGGPIGGALLGFAGGILRKSEKFNDWLFGAKDKEGNRTGGLISKNVQDYMKENGKFLAGGAALGAIKGALSGGGVLGSIVGGPVAGALMGLGTAIILKSDTWKKFIFGDPENGQIGLKGHWNRWMKKLGASSTDDPSGGRLAGMMGVGAIGGGLLGALVGGPVIGATIGLGASILAQKENFHEWLFGKVDKETGERKEGIFGKFKNMLMADVINPIGNSVKNILTDAKTFVKYDILGKLNLVVGQIGDSFVSAVSRITGSAMASLSDFGNYIKTNFLDKMITGLGKVFAPLTKAGTKVAEAMYGAGKALISAPINLLQSLFSPAVKAVTSIVGGTVKAIGATINTIVIKPLKTLVLKPLAGAVKLAGKVVAAPFKLVSSMFNWVNDKIVGTFKHISRFFGVITENVRNAIHDAVDKHIKQPLIKLGKGITNVIFYPFTILGRFAKNTMQTISDHIKEKVNGFFDKAKEVLNPFKLIQKVFNWGKDKLGLNTTKEGQGEEQPKKGLFGSLRTIWKQTASGNKQDYSDRLIYDKDNNPIDSKDSYAVMRKHLLYQRDAEYAQNAEKKNLLRQQSRNQQLIKKYTKGQRYQDTEENRKLAEAALGRKISWLTEKPTEQTKTEKFQDQTVKTGTKIEENTSNTAVDVHKILEFLGIVNKSAGSKSDSEKKEDIDRARELGKSTQANRNARQERIDEASSQGTYHDKRDAKDLRVVDKKLREKEDEEYSKMRAQRSNGGKGDLAHNLHQDIAFISGEVAASDGPRWLKWLFKDRSKTRRSNTDTDTVDTNATGTSGAKPGFSIVGEQGPEVVYGKNGKYGKFVGLHGPEVVRMKGGETVIPNSRIARYEEGTDGYDGPTLSDLIHGGKGMSDDDLAKVTDTSKLSIGERILKSITDIKAFILSVFTPRKARKVAVSSDDTSMTSQQDAQSQVSGLTGDAATSSEATVSEAPAGSIIAEADSISLGTMTSRVGDPTSIADSSNTDMVNDGAENTMADQQAAQAQVSGLTGDSLRAQAEVDKDKERQEAREEEKLATLKELGKDTKEHSSIWNSIFSKKGLITAGLIAAIPLLLKLFNGGLGGILGNLLNSVVNGIKNTLEDFKFAQDYGLGDGRNSIEVVQDEVSNLKDSVDALKDGNLKEAWNHWIYDENGQVTNQTAARAKLGLKTGAKVIAGAASTIPVATKVGKGIWNVGKKLVNKGAFVAAGVKEGGLKGGLKNLVTKAPSLADDAVKAGADDAAKLGVKGGSKYLVKTGTDMMKKGWAKITGKAAASSADDIAEGAAKLAAGSLDDVAKVAAEKSTGLLDNVISMVSKFVDDVIAKISKVTGKQIGKVGGGLVDDVSKCLKKHFGKIAEKVSGILGVAAGLATTVVGLAAKEATWVVLGALNGATGAKRLFRTDKVDALMVTISTALGAFNGTTIGSICDVVNELVTTVTGVDIYTELASVIYSFLAGQEKADLLRAGQEAFQQQFKTDMDTELSKQYDTMVEAGLINPNEVSKDQYISGSYNGDYAASIQSFADYNDEKHKDLGATVWSGMKKAGGWVSDKWHDAFGKKVTYQVDEQTGNRYIDNGDGTYQVTDANGKDLGYVSKDAISEDRLGEKVTEKQKGAVGKALGKAWDATKNWASGAWEDTKNFASKTWQGAKNLGKKAVSGIKSGAKKAWNGVKNFFGGAKDKVKDAGAKVAEVASKSWNALKDGVKWLTTKETTDGYYSTDGTYYTTDGSHYTANGELIEKVSLSDLSLMITSGQIDGPVEIVTKEAGWKTLLNKATSSIKEGFNKMVGNVKDFGKKALDKAVEIGAKGIAAFNKAKTSVTNFFKSHTEKAWFDTDGSYYKSDGKEYIHYNASGSQIGDPISEEEFQALITAGTLTEGEIEVDAGLKTTIKNIGSSIKEGWSKFKTGASNLWSTVKEKAGNMLTKAKEKITGAATSVKNFFTSHTEQVWYDSDGGYYQVTNDGYVHYNASGSQIGDPIGEEEFQALITSGALVAGELQVDPGIKTTIKNIGNSIKESWNKFTTGASNLWSSVKEKAGNLLTKAKEKITGAATSVKNFFVSHTEKAWFDSEGGYYKSANGGFIHYNASGSQIGDPISADDFQALVTSGAVVEGELQVDSGLKSKIKDIGNSIKEGWNKFTTGASNLWSSVKEKAGNVFTKAKEKLTSITGSIGAFFVGRTEKRYHSTDGGYYQSNGSTFDYYNQNGDLMTQGISAEDFAALVASGVVSEDDVEEVTVSKGLKQKFSDMVNMGTEVFTKLHAGASAMWSQLKEGAGNLFTSIKDAGGPFKFIGGLFTKKKNTGWFDTNGNYYMLDSSGEKYTYYNMNGDVLQENIDAEKVNQLAQAGLLTDQPVEVDTEAQKAIKEIKSAVKSAWSTAKTTVKSAWSSFKNWITGGSGSGSSASTINSYRPNSSTGTGGYGKGIPSGGGFGEPETLNGIPYYSQNDSRWADREYEQMQVDDGATMADSGCGPTAMSMVIGKMTNQKPLPTELADYAQFTGTRDNTGTNWNFIDSAANSYGLDSRRSINPSPEFIETSLAKGNPMVLSGQDTGFGISPYTRAGHYIVATGIDSNGNIKYNDPRGSAYSGSININSIIGDTSAAWSFTKDLTPTGYGNYKGKNYFKTHGGYGPQYRMISLEDDYIYTDVNRTPSTPSTPSSTPTPTYTPTIGTSEKTYTGPQLIVAIAASQIGVAEAGGDDNRVPYNDEYYGSKVSGSKYPWCCAFVWWVFKHAGLSELFGPKTAGCGTFHSNHTNDTIPFEQARAGDIVLYHPTGSYSHIGIVSADYNPETKTIQTIEGNSGNKVSNHKSVANSNPPKVIVHPHYTNNLYKFDLTPLEELAASWIAGNHNASVGNTGGIISGTYDNSSSLLSTGFQATGNVISDVGSILGTIGSTLFNAALTGNTDIDWNAVLSGAASTGLTSSSAFTGDSSSNLVIPNNVSGAPTFGTNKGQMLSDTNISSLPSTYDYTTSKDISPSANAEATWKYFKSMGASDVATAGVLGNLFAESGVIPNNLQSASAAKDAEYTANVDNGSYTGNQFAHDSKGYGLAQWTYHTLKQKLYDFRNAKKTSIGDHGMQNEFLYRELYGDYPDIFNFMNSTTEVGKASTAMVRFFERPASVSDPNSEKAHNTYNKRAGYAKGYYDLYSGKYPTGGSGGGFGDGKDDEHKSFTIQNRRYVTSVPKAIEGGSGESEDTVSHPIKSTINMHELSKSTGGYGFIQSNTIDTYDDTVVVQMMNQIIRYLSSISTNTKKLDLLSDIRDKPSTIINANNSGNTTVERSARDIVRDNTVVPRSNPSFSRSELRARSIAGLV